MKLGFGVLMLTLFWCTMTQKNIMVTFTPAYSHFQMLEALAVEISKTFPGKYNFTFVSYTTEDFNYAKNLKLHNNSLINSNVCKHYNVSLQNIAKEGKHFELFTQVFESYFNCLQNAPKPDLIISENLIISSFDYAYENKIPIIGESVIMSDLLVHERGLCQSNEPRFFQFIYGFSGYTWNPLLLFISQLYCRNFPFRVQELQVLALNPRKHYSSSKIDWSQAPSIPSLMDSSPVIFFSYPGILEYQSYIKPNYHLVGPMISKIQINTDSMVSKWIESNNDKKWIYFNMGSAWSHTEERIQEIFDSIVNILKDETISVIFRSNIQMESKLLAQIKGKPYQSRLLLTSKSLPQKFLLSQKNMRLFLTHCGYSSVVESLFFGVPLLGIPIQADQFCLCNRLQDFGYGKCGENYDKNEIEKQISLILKSEEIIKKMKYVGKILNSISPHNDIEKLIEQGINLGSFELIYTKQIHRTYLSIFIDYFTPIFELFFIYYLYKFVKHLFTRCFCVQKEKIE